MEKKLNKDGQPISRGFHYGSNKLKALQSLRGILQGVIADQKLNDIELMFLDVWLRSDAEYKKDGDFLDLLDLLEDVLEDGIISQDELSEVQGFLNDVLDYGYQGALNDIALTNQLLGFLQGITADDQLKDAEIVKLTEILAENPEIASQWPGNSIIKRLDTILEDGVIDDEERSDLLVMLKGICGQQFTDTGCAECHATDFFAADVVIDSLENKNICFTGKFFAGSRKIMESLAKANGAIVKKDVTQDLDFLVIGSMASRDWKFTSHGRKIEAAIKNQDLGYPSQIINEELWIKFVED